MSKGKLIIVSGAGLSASAGLATFRGSNGIWNDVKIDDVCNMAKFWENYDLVHEFYNKRRVELAGVEPTIAHRIIAKLYEMAPDRVVNITTNVDDFFDRLKVPTVYLHGKIREVKTGYSNENRSGNFIDDIGYTEVDYATKRDIKPNVVFFGEVAPEYITLDSIVYGCTQEDTVVIVGSSENVIDFRTMFKYTTNVAPPKIFFVNPDVSLCEKDNISDEVFNMESDKFFQGVGFSILSYLLTKDE